jgi:hypothetical protein
MHKTMMVITMLPNFISVLWWRVISQASDLVPNGISGFSCKGFAEDLSANGGCAVLLHVEPSLCRTFNRRRSAGWTVLLA